MELTNSKRLLYTASYVTTQLTPEEQREAESKPGGGYSKANLLRSLDLKPEDLDRLWTAMNIERAPRYRAELRKLFAIAHQLAERPMSMMELASILAPLSYDAITHFAEQASKVKENSIGTKILLSMNEQRRRISPIGRIHLERIEMYPAGVEKGELVFSVPMAPGETVTISHKEWSTSSREFEEIVQDSFESYSERGVAEKTDAAMSSESEAKRSSAIDFGASMSGSYGGVTLTTTVGNKETRQEQQSVKQSMQKNREVTEKASARTRKEHKVSMKLETKMGSEDHSAKTITNPGANAIRIDYYRMMRKWRTDLFRYGLRQTYDIAIPLPGVRLWALHQQLADLDARIRAPLQFGLQPQALNGGNYRAEALKLQTRVDDEPPAQLAATALGITDYFKKDHAGEVRFGQVEFDVPQGYQVLSGNFGADMALWPGLTQEFRVLNASDSGPIVNNSHVSSNLPEHTGATGHQVVRYTFRGVSQASIEILLQFSRQTATYEAWQRSVWGQLRAAAEARHLEERGRLQEERDRLSRLLNGKDTLSLRRLEREELVRLVMQWLLGPDLPVVSSPGDGVFPAAPVQPTMSKLLANERAFRTAKADPVGPSYSPTFSGITDDAWFQALEFGEFVKFVHQAIEWENLLYFLYPYFWGSETLGRDKMLFTHSDPEHERFLRAGYARIVLAVRPGFEEEFTRVIEQGAIAQRQTTPYLTVAQEIANFARTNYAGIPPANPEQHARPLLFPEQRATWEVMQDIMKKIDKFKVENGNYPAKLDDLDPEQPLPVDAWGNPFLYRMPGLGADYDLTSLGADNEEGGEGLKADISSAAGASLVATWFDYTPTSALDIEVDTKPEDIA
jgi:hypothetical protein